MNIKNFTLCFVVLMVGLIGMPQNADAETVTKTVEESVRDYFKEVPVMIEIARCESKFRQYNSDGSPLFGGWGGGMIGVFQLYDSVHRSAAAGLGFDIATLEGNLGYAKHLYTISGTQPWNSAKACWGAASATTMTPDLSAAKIVELQARIATLKKLVVELQELLEKKKELTLR